MQANVWGQGTDQGLLGNGERGGKEVGTGGALEVVDVLPFWMGAMFSQVQREIQRDPALHLKHAWFVVCQLHLSKAVFWFGFVLFCFLMKPRHRSPAADRCQGADTLTGHLATK